MNGFYAKIERICSKDSRYKADAYEFVMQGLSFTQGKLKVNGHLSGRQLAEGLRDFAISQYGPMARAVLKHWGITRTRDFGNIVFNMIEGKLLSKSAEDSLRDFDGLYDFDSVFNNLLVDIAIEDAK